MWCDILPLPNWTDTSNLNAEASFAGRRVSVHIFRRLLHYFQMQASHQMALPIFLRSYWLMGRTETLMTSSVVPLMSCLCRLLSVPAARRFFPTLSLQSLYRCLDPYPAVSFRCFYSFLPEKLRPHLRISKFGTPHIPYNATSTGGSISERQSFHYVKASILARPPGCTHR